MDEHCNGAETEISVLVRMHCRSNFYIVLLVGGGSHSLTEEIEERKARLGKEKVLSG